MIAAPPPPPRSPWQRLYGAALAARRRRALGRAARLPVPVVSIGNLRWGGGGKTPLVIAVAERLAAGGRRVGVLSRGYGRTSRGPLVVGRGAGPEADARKAGDEPYLMASRLAGVAVVVGESRRAAGERALAEIRPAPELFLLDDGFSHVSLARDLEILAFPADDPWAGGRLLPSGRLREPLTAAAAADAVVLTGAPAPGNGGELARALAPFGFGGEAFASATLAGAPRRPDGAPLEPATRVWAVAAIARPERFFAAARAAGLEVAGTTVFRDHHPYSARDVAGIAAAARAARAAALLTTEKDAAKLAGRIDLPLAVLPVEARPEPRFWAWLEARLDELQR